MSLFRIVAVFAFLLCMRCAEGHPLPQALWGSEEPSAVPITSPEATLGSPAEKRHTFGRGALHASPYTVSVPGAVEEEEDIAEGSLHRSHSKDFVGKGEGNDSAMMAITPVPEVAPEVETGYGTHTTSAPSVDASSSYGAAVSPNAAEETIGAGENGENFARVPVASAAPVVTVSVSPVSGADVADNILESLVSTSPDSAGHVRPSPSASIIASPSPSGSVAVIATPTPKGACFPGGATVKLQGGAVKKMNELRISDSVEVGNGEYSPVFMFTHKLPSVVTKFVRLRTHCGHTLDLSASHYVYVNGRLAAASSAGVGDVLRLGNSSISAIASVDYVWEKGLFNPQTLHGNIVVNGVTASTYTRAVQACAAHALLAPLRFLYEQFKLSAMFPEGEWFAHEYFPNGDLVIV